MKPKLNILFLIICLVSFQSADAQLFKRLKKKAKEKAKNIENKVINKVENEVDKTVDRTIEGRGNPDKGKPAPKTAAEKKDFGNITINHTQKYGSVAITELSQVTVSKTNSGYTIAGNWWSHEADIYDGFKLVVKTTADLKNATDSGKRTFKIPEEASLQLGYDPQLPYNKKSDDNFKRAVTDDYQNYDVLKGEVTVAVLSDEKVQLSFSGEASLRTVIRKANSSDYSETFYNTTINGEVTGKSPKYTSEETVTKTNNSQNTSNTGYSITPSTANNTPTPGIYQFSYEAVTEISVPEQNRSYKMSYLLNPNTKYIAMKADMSEYSEDEMDGESIIVMDKGNAHIFVETSGMKMRMSSGMMGQKMQNPTEQMANYDYTKLQKTGNTKTILGATCHEYAMSDKNVKVNFWVAPSIKLSNWFMQNTGVVDGYIMEYSVQSKDGNMTSKTIAIKENINKTVNPKEYKKMF
jgi:hypothetical protein